MAYIKAIENARNQLKGISDESMHSMVDLALEKGAKKEDDASAKDAQMRVIEEILADHLANEIIAAGYWRPGWRSVYYRPYYPPYRGYYVSPSVSYQITRLLGFEDYLKKYELINDILGHTLSPKLEELLSVIYDLVYGKGGSKPAAKTLL
jgi:hypothetical protein